MKDRFGNVVSASSSKSVEAVDYFVGQMLGNGAQLAGILDAAAADPDCALAQAWSAVLMMFHENGAARANARPYVAAAEKAAANATDYEKLFVAAVAAWVGDEERLALKLFVELATLAPNFLAGAKLGQIRAFFHGDWLTHLRLSEIVTPAHPKSAYAFGMLAFALEQCHRLFDAEQAAEQALKLDPAEPWSQHALAHVYYSRGRFKEGVALMDGAKGGWHSLNSFMQTHNWWHFALFHLEVGNTAETLRLYDSHVWGVDKTFSSDQVGAVALLARLGFVGVDVGDRWQDVANYLLVRADENGECFNDLQYLYGLGRAGRAEADKLLDGMRRHAAARPDWSRSTWTQVCVPMAEGVLAHARGDWNHAADRLRDTRERWVAIGGSIAQRDLFTQIYLDALIQAERWGEAADLLEVRLMGAPHVGWVASKLATVYAKAGLTASAGWAEAHRNVNW